MSQVARDDFLNAQILKILEPTYAIKTNVKKAKVTHRRRTIAFSILIFFIVLFAGGNTYNVFDPIMEGYFWKYNNNGLKLLQLRFYPILATN
jgi:hypothetical protein